MKKIIIILSLIFIFIFSNFNQPVINLIDNPYIISDKISIIKDTKDIKPFIEVSTASSYTIDVDMKYVQTHKKGIYNALVTLNTPDKIHHKIIQVEVLDKIMYLTFDDGPSYNTIKILEILDKYDIKATFFVTAENKNYKYLIKEAHLKGHTIGLHTYTHDYSYIYSSKENYFRDLNQIDEYVEDILGIKTPYIRFPGGSSNTISKKYSKGIMSLLSKEIQAKGYQYYDWNLSSSDAEKPLMKKEDIIKSSVSKTYNGNNDYIILLMHDTSSKTTTVEALPEIIEYYLNKGYTFKPIDKTSFIYHQKIHN